MSTVHVVLFEWNDPLKRLGHDTKWWRLLFSAVVSFCFTAVLSALSLLPRSSHCADFRSTLKGLFFSRWRPGCTRQPPDQIGPEVEQAAFSPPLLSPSLVFLPLSLSNGRKPGRRVGRRWTPSSPPARSAAPLGTEAWPPTTEPTVDFWGECTHGVQFVKNYYVGANLQWSLKRKKTRNTRARLNVTTSKTYTNT